MTTPEKRKRGRPRKTAPPVKGRKAASAADCRLKGDSFQAARTRMAKIKEYWLDRGYEVKAEIVEMPDEPGRYEVKTDLVAGMPRGFKDPARARTAARHPGSGVSPIFSYRDLVRDGLR